jgi:hypothetical protein
MGSYTGSHLACEYTVSRSRKKAKKGKIGVKKGPKLPKWVKKGPKTEKDPPLKQGKTRLPVKFGALNSEAKSTWRGS